MTSLLPIDQIVGFHPLTATLPGLWPDDSEELVRLGRDILKRGLDQPLLVVRSLAGFYLVADGRNRFRAAINIGVEKIKVDVREESEVAEIILHTLVDRRHLSKGALAYITFPVISAMVAPKEIHLLRGPKSTESTTENLSDQSASATEIAGQLGFSRDLFFQARQIHEKFAKRPDLKARFEPMIVAGEMGLGACLAGIAGMDATLGGGRNDRPLEQLLMAGFKDLKGRFSKWDTLGEPARAQVLNNLTETVFELPADVQASLHTALQAKHA